MIAPGPKAPTETFEVPRSKDETIYGEWFPTTSAKANALILHGYAEHCGRYREVANVLNASGLSALSFDFRGHGRSTGQRGFIRSFSDYHEDVLLAIAELNKRCDPALPLVIVAHSNGALVALHMLCSPAPAITPTFLVVSSPFLGLGVEVPAAKKALATIAGKLVPTLALPNELTPDMLTSDKEKQNERAADTLCHDVANARWYTEAKSAQEMVKNRAPDMRVPSSWLVAGNDQIANPETARAVRSKLTAQSTLTSYDSMQHEIFNESDRAKVFEDLSTVISDQLFRPSEN